MAKKSQWETSGAGDRRNPTVSASVAVSAVRNGGDEANASPTPPRPNAIEALKRLATYDEGWLRIVSHEEGLNMYYKFKFSRGKYAGKYVMWWDVTGDIGGALWGLLGKVEAVYDGNLNPTNDTPYD